jgi:bifunctional non-homologous end joining protein LigD
MTLSPRSQPFDHPDWLFELKHDGFRALAYIERGKRELVSRRRNTYKRFGPLREALSKLLRVNDAILDGEIVCLEADGYSVFKELLYRRGQPVYYAFDLLWLNGRDLRQLLVIPGDGFR